MVAFHQLATQGFSETHNTQGEGGKCCGKLRNLSKVMSWFENVRQGETYINVF